MATLDLLKSAYTGKLGKTVGAKWKNKATLRTLTIPTYTDTPEQQIIRQGFGDVASFTSLFCSQLRTLTSWDTRGMSVRNAIIKYNKAKFLDGSFSPALLTIAKGGLTRPASLSLTATLSPDKIAAAWTPITTATISDKAKVVIVAANQEQGIGIVGAGPYSTGALQISATLPPSTDLECYYYLLDYRGSSRVCSMSTHIAITTPAS
jgi:hypothetical protein